MASSVGIGITRGAHTRRQGGSSTAKSTRAVACALESSSRNRVAASAEGRKAVLAQRHLQNALGPLRRASTVANAAEGRQPTLGLWGRLVVVEGHREQRVLVRILRRERL